MVQVCGKMGRNNAKFKHREIANLSKDESGFYSLDSSREIWSLECECYIEKSIPAKQRFGADGHTYNYTYEVFIPKHYQGKVELNSKMVLLFDDGSQDEITILGVDNLNRRNIIVWG